MTPGHGIPPGCGLWSRERQPVVLGCWLGHAAGAFVGCAQGRDVELGVLAASRDCLGRALVGSCDLFCAGGRRAAGAAGVAALVCPTPEILLPASLDETEHRLDFDPGIGALKAIRVVCLAVRRVKTSRWGTDVRPRAVGWRLTVQGAVWDALRGSRCSHLVAVVAGLGGFGFDCYNRQALQGVSPVK